MKLFPTPCALAEKLRAKLDAIMKRDRLPR